MVPTSTQPTAQSAPTLRPFQKGVSIDWQNREIYIDARVVLRAGPLEFLACFAGKEHESVLRLEASAEHVYLALGLIGLQPGNPPRWDADREEYSPATGDLVDVWIELEEEGRTRRVLGFEWTRTSAYAQPPVSQPWVFAGSKRAADGTLLACRTGEGLALVDMPNSLLALATRHPSSNADLWLEANTEEIPAAQTRVRMIFTPARPRRHRVLIDFRGAIFIDDRYAEPAELVDAISWNLQLDSKAVQLIEAETTLRTEITRISKSLHDAGLPASAFRITAKKESSP